MPCFVELSQEPDQHCHKAAKAGCGNRNEDLEGHLGIPPVLCLQSSIVRYFLAEASGGHSGQNNNLFCKAMLLLQSATYCEAMRSEDKACHEGRNDEEQHKDKDALSHLQIFGSIVSMPRAPQIRAASQAELKDVKLPNQNFGFEQASMVLAQGHTRAGRVCIEPQQTIWGLPCAVRG